MKIVADPNIPFVMDAFRALGDVTLVPGRQITAATVHDADVLLVRSVTPVNASLLADCRVQFVATATIGTDHIDEPWLAEYDIGFASAAGSNANSVAEYVVAALLEMSHRQAFRLRDKTLGIIGVGNVGSKVSRYARALGLQVLENDPPRQRVENQSSFVDLATVLAQADIVTTHVPLTRTGPDATFHLLHGGNLGHFNVINTARGAVVDNAALTKALENTHVPAAVLDVWEGEPQISRELLAVVDLGTPHIAGYSFDGKVAGTRMIYEAACRHFHQAATWQPVLPPAAVAQLEVNASPAEDAEDILRRTIRLVYDIQTDDTALRQSPAAFDRLRADYPVRREFHNTTLTLPGVAARLREQFKALGFRVAD